MAGAMTRVTGPAAEAWRPQIQNGDTNSESIPNMYKVQRIDHANKNKMEATNPNVFTFLDYECKPLQWENELFFAYIVRSYRLSEGT
jgi:hypothetical protein